MSDVPGDLKFLSSHEWVRLNDDGTASIGISDHAQDLLGDIVFIELPEIGKEIQASDDVAIVESVKAASDVYAPLSGQIVEVNASLEDQPEKVNDSPYDEGWFFKIKPIDLAEMDELLPPERYAEICED
tara:strand:+ start:1600 stop:1986 length:387 start_codon:yes stop_codon:yes gene_type:complete